MFTRGGVYITLGRQPQRQTPSPWADTHPGQTPILGRNPLRQTHPRADTLPPGQTPLAWEDTPCPRHRHCSGRYASYWNAFLYWSISKCSETSLMILSSQHNVQYDKILHILQNNFVPTSTQDTSWLFEGHWKLILFLNLCQCTDTNRKTTRENTACCLSMNREIWESVFSYYLGAVSWHSKTIVLCTFALN